MRGQWLDGRRDKSQHFSRGIAGNMGISARAGAASRIWSQHSTRYHPQTIGHNGDIVVVRRTGVFLLTITEKGGFLDLAFEAVSAAAAVGLSRGITADLSVAG